MTGGTEIVLGKRVGNDVQPTGMLEVGWAGRSSNLCARNSKTNCSLCAATLCKRRDSPAVGGLHGTSLCQSGACRTRGTDLRGYSGCRILKQRSPHAGKTIPCSCGRRRDGRELLQGTMGRSRVVLVSTSTASMPPGRRRAREGTCDA